MKNNSKDFKFTDLGRIPNYWKIIRLEQIIKEIKNGFASGKRDEDGIVQIRMNNVTTDGRLIFDSYLKVPVPESLDEWLLKKGDFLFNNTNSIDLVGKSAIFFNAPCPCTFSNHFTRIRFKEELVLPELMLYYFLILWAKGYFKSVAIRHVGQSAVHTEYILRLKLPLPPLPEQKKIAEVLSTVDQAIDKVDKAIEKTQRVKKGLMQELLTKGIGHREYKDSEIGRIPKEWQIKKIYEICKVRRGASPRPIGDYSYFSKSGRGWIRISDVTNTYKYIRKTNQYLSKKGEERSVKVNPGDLIMSICATIGKPIILDMQACIHDGFVWFSELSEKTDVEFLFYILQKNEEKFSNKRQVGTQGNLNTTLVGKTYIPLPSLFEQKKIAGILSTVDDRLELSRRRKEKFQRLKRGLMNDLLTGKKRVKLEA